VANLSSSKPWIFLCIFMLFPSCGRGIAERDGSIASNAQDGAGRTTLEYRVRAEESPFLFGPDEAVDASLLSRTRPPPQPSPKEGRGLEPEFEEEKDFLEVYVNTNTQRMRLRRNGSPLEEPWPISTGVRGDDTPIGSFSASSAKEAVLLTFGESVEQQIYLPHVLEFGDNLAIYGVGPAGISRLGSRQSFGGVRLHPFHARKLYEYVMAIGWEKTRVIVF
jgi:hypothetical protein